MGIKMAKQRKEYMEEAERCALRLFMMYHKENNSAPSDSVIKSAMTKAKNFASSAIYQEARKRLGVSYTNWSNPLSSHPDYDKVIEQIFKEIEEDVDNFRIRQQNS